MTPQPVCPYEVRVIGEDGVQDDPFIFKKNVDTSLCTSDPPQEEAKEFMRTLATEHDQEVLKSKPWNCWNCEKQATSMLHTPMSYLHRAQPQVVDFALPICEKEGACDHAGRTFVAEEVEDMTRGRRGMHA